MTTCAPSLARPAAVARPMPEVAPVIRQVRPSSRARANLPLEPERLERRHHLLGEEPRRYARVAPEELDHEQAAAKLAVALDALDHLIRPAPDAVLLEAGAQMTAVDLLGLLQRGPGRLHRLLDHHHALLRDLQCALVAPDLPAALAERLDL